MATIGNLVVNIQARTAKFAQDIDKATSKLQKFGSGAVKVAKTVGLAFAGIATAATAALAAITKSSLDSIDVLGKTADKLGLTTEALGGLRLAAELTGVSTQTLDMALQRMTRRISEAAAGTGEAQAALIELGLNAERLNQLTPDQAFREIADAMGQVENSSDRLRLAFKLFDSEGASLVNTLALGSEQLQEIAEDAETYGIALTRIDVAKVEAANDAFVESKSVLKGLGNALAVNLAPFLEEINVRFIEAAKQSGGFVNFVGRGMEKVVDAIGRVADVLRNLKAVFLAINIAFATVAEGILQSIATMDSGLTTFLNKFSILTKRTFEENMFIQDWADSASSRVIRLNEELDKLALAERPSEQLQTFFEEITFAAEERARKISEVKQMAQDGNGIEELREQELNDFGEHEKNLTKILETEAKKRIQIEQQSQSLIFNARSSVVSSSIQLLQIFAGKSRAAAIAAIVLGKALSIAQAIQNTAVAFTKALAIDPTGSLAARVAALGKIQIGLIAATGLAQAANVGGGGAELGTPANPINTQTVPSSVPNQQGQQIGVSTNIIVIGGGAQDVDIDDLIDNIRDKIETGDRIIVPTTSRNAEELAAIAT